MSLLTGSPFHDEALRLFEREHRFAEIPSAQMRVHERLAPGDAAAGAADNLEQPEPVELMTVIASPARCKSEVA